MTDADYQRAIDVWATLVDLVDLLLETFDTPADIFKTDDVTMQARREHAEGHQPGSQRAHRGHQGNRWVGCYSPLPAHRQGARTQHGHGSG